jgi:hypothetical protein
MVVGLSRKRLVEPVSMISLGRFKGAEQKNTRHSALPRRGVAGLLRLTMEIACGLASGE